MIKKIRNKFVIITMSMLTVVFGILLLASTISDKYWYKQDIIQLLDDLSNSEQFRNMQMWTDEEYPEIYMAFFNENGKLEYINSYGNIENNKEKSSYTARKIYEENDENGTIDSYIYSTKDENNGRFIAFANLHSPKRKTGEVVGTIIIIIAAFGLLLGVSIFLSRFITEPAQKALEREKQFISDASHELKTPVAAVKLNAQAMLNGVPSKHLRNILSEADRMDRLIRRLLTLAYADESENHLEKARFSLSESCEEILLSLESIAYEKGIDLEYDVENGILYNGSCEDIKQLVSILLDNAFKYTPKDGQVRFSLKKIGTHPTMCVYNTGSGITDEDLPHIFERFYCCESSRSTESFGLGLSIAKAIVTAHGGKISAESQYGEYVRFTVLL